MKITMTLAEIKAMVAREYRLPYAFELEIVDADVSTEGDCDWISKIGRDRSGRPDSLAPDTKIEIKYRSGFTTTGIASFWSASWRETEGTSSDIVAYRVIK